MDHRAIFEIIDAAVFDMENSTCDELMQLQNFVEYVVIEDKKTELFQDRINFICLANCFAAAMERDYNCKQIKTFLKRSGFSEDAATKTANKLNEARRVYPRLSCFSHFCPDPRGIGTNLAQIFHHSCNR